LIFHLLGQICKTSKKHICKVRKVNKQQGPSP